MKSKDKALTDVTCRNAEPRDKTYRISDSNGLYLEVTPTGSKLWRYKYRFGGKEKRLAIGIYPVVGLKAARDALVAARRKLADGIDPSAAKKAAREAQKVEAVSAAMTFEKVALEWHGKQVQTWTERHAGRLLQRLQRDVFPYIAKLPINEIRHAHIRPILKMVEDKGYHESAHRVQNIISLVFRYAIAHGLTEINPAADLQGTLAPVVVKHRASIIDPRQVGALLRALDSYQTRHYPVKCAIRLLPLVFVRPGELRKAEWREFDLANSVWRIPAARMKMRTPHIVPLSRQAIAILEELKPLTGERRLLFPSVRSFDREISENTLNGVLRRLGYTQDEMTSHGFRSIASSLLNEKGWRGDIVERQLAHAERDGVRAAYNHADYLADRVRMMQDWADYLDELKRGS